MEIAVLNVVKNLTAKIEKEKVRLLRLKSLSQSCTAELDGMPHGQNKSSRVESLAAAIVDCENRINELATVRIDCKIELAIWLENQIENSEQCQVLFQRYGHCKPFSVIARELNYSLPSVFRLHRIGLKALNIKAKLSDNWEFDSKIKVE